MANTYKFGKFRNDFAPAKFEGSAEDDLKITSSSSINTSKAELTTVVNEINALLGKVKAEMDKLNKHANSGKVIQRTTKSASNHCKKVAEEFTKSVNTLNSDLNTAIMNAWIDNQNKDKANQASEAASGSVSSMSAR